MSIVINTLTVIIVHFIFIPKNAFKNTNFKNEFEVFLKYHDNNLNGIFASMGIFTKRLQCWNARSATTKYLGADK